MSELTQIKSAFAKAIMAFCHHVEGLESLIEARPFYCIELTMDRSPIWVMADPDRLEDPRCLPRGFSLTQNIHEALQITGREQARDFLKAFRILVPAEKIAEFDKYHPFTSEHLLIGDMRLETESELRS